ncbi:uncharacterized protein LOC143560876 [Bidens hawaiensis]|uniref:uncharacterized protein LOC143560876 n=1 Tax=Bidens hawaiensis TaxID=980011 RepID=UPI00404A7A8B
MSSEIYEFDGCFFNDSFSPFNDSSSSIDIMQAFQEHNYSYTPISPPLASHENLDETDQTIPTILSTSPPNLDNLSLYQKGIPVTSSSEALDFCASEVKIENTQLPSYDHYYYGGSDNALKMMQRSYSSNSFQQGRSNGVVYQPKFNGLIDTPHLDSQVLTSLDHCFASTHMRRVCSTGDLQVSLHPSLTPKFDIISLFRCFYQNHTSLFFLFIKDSLSNTHWMCVYIYYVWRGRERKRGSNKNHH